MKKGDEMTVLISIFIACVVAMFAAIWVYNKSESTAFNKTQEQILAVKRQVDEINALLVSNISTIASANLKIRDLDDRLTCATGVIEKDSERIYTIDVACAKLKEQMIDLRMAVASKRPVTTFKGPLQVEVLTRADVKAKAKEVAKKIKDMNL